MKKLLLLALLSQFGSTDGDPLAPSGLINLRRRLQDGGDDTPSETPADEPADAPADGGDDAADGGDDTPSETPADGPADEPADEPADAPADGGDDAADGGDDTPSETPSETPADEPADEPADAPSDGVEVEDTGISCGLLFTMYDTIFMIDPDMLCPFSFWNDEASDEAISVTPEEDEELFGQEMMHKCCVDPEMRCVDMKRLFSMSWDTSEDELCPLSKWNDDAHTVVIEGYNPYEGKDNLDVISKACCVPSENTCGSFKQMHEKNWGTADYYCPISKWDNTTDGIEIECHFSYMFEEETELELRQEVYEKCCEVPEKSTCGVYKEAATNYGVDVDKDVCIFSTWNDASDDVEISSSVHAEHGWNKEMYEKCCEPLECTLETQGIRNADHQYCCTDMEGNAAWHTTKHKSENPYSEEEEQQFWSNQGYDCSCAAPSTLGSDCFGEAFDERDFPKYSYMGQKQRKMSCDGYMGGEQWESMRSNEDVPNSMHFIYTTCPTIDKYSWKNECQVWASEEDEKWGETEDYYWYWGSGSGSGSGYDWYYLMDYYGFEDYEEFYEWYYSEYYDTDDWGYEDDDWYYSVYSYTVGPRPIPDSPRGVDLPGASTLPAKKQDKKHHDGKKHHPKNHEGKQHHPKNHDGKKHHPKNHDGKKHHPKKHHGKNHEHFKNHDGKKHFTHGKAPKKATASAAPKGVAKKLAQAAETADDESLATCDFIKILFSMEFEEASGSGSGFDLDDLCYFSWWNNEAGDEEIAGSMSDDEFFVNAQESCCAVPEMKCADWKRMVYGFMMTEPDEFCLFSEWDGDSDRTVVGGNVYGDPSVWMPAVMGSCCVPVEPTCGGYHEAFTALVEEMDLDFAVEEFICPISSWDESNDETTIVADPSTFLTATGGEELFTEIYESCCVPPTSTTCGDYQQAASKFGTQKTDICLHGNWDSSKTDEVITANPHQEQAWKKELYETCCNVPECTIENQGIKNAEGQYCCTSKNGVTAWYTERNINMYMTEEENGTYWSDDGYDCSCKDKSTNGRVCFGKDFDHWETKMASSMSCDGFAGGRNGYEWRVETSDVAPISFGLSSNCPTQDTWGMWADYCVEYSREYYNEWGDYDDYDDYDVYYWVYTDDGYWVYMDDGEWGSTTSGNPNYEVADGYYDWEYPAGGDMTAGGYYDYADEDGQMGGPNPDGDKGPGGPYTGGHEGSGSGVGSGEDDELDCLDLLQEDLHTQMLAASVALLCVLILIVICLWCYVCFARRSAIYNGPQVSFKRQSGYGVDA